MPVRLKDIAAKIRPVSPDMPAAAVLGLFLSEPELFAVPVATQEAALGQVTRARLTEALAGPDGREVHARRPIHHFIAVPPVMADAETPVALIAKQAAEGGSAALTDGVLVLEDGRYVGIASARAILKAVAEENAARARAMQAAQRKLEQAKLMMQERTQEKTRFLAFLGHEIRTPLSGILGVADLLQETGSAREARKLARTISESGHHLDRLLGDLLDLSRLEAGKVPLNPAPFDLRVLAAELKTLWGASLSGKPIELRVKIENGSEMRLESDIMRVRQIVFNLLSNAVKFTEQGIISVNFSTRREKDTLRLDVIVADSGCGIPDADKARLFEAFEQAHASTAEKHGGSGLGLAIAKGLTQRMQGTLTLTDNPGGGSVFTLSLPVLRAGPRAVADVARPPSTRKLKLERVLVVDDHAVSAFVIAQGLEAAGWRVDISETLNAAQQRLASTDYQAVLTDMHLGAQSGMEIVRTLSMPGVRNHFTPVLAISADCSPEAQAGALRAGFRAFIEKPVRPRLLVATLAELLMNDEARWAESRRTSRSA